MRTHREAKAMAKTLRACLADKNVDVSHSECLEVVARQFGFSDWNVMAGMLQVEAGTAHPDSNSRNEVRLSQVIPVLHVPRIAESKAFYGDFLGFSCNWDGTMETGGTDEMPGHALLFRDDIEIHLAELRSAAIQGGEVMIRMRALEAFHRELSGRNSGFKLTEVRFTPWDSQIFRVVDPFGNRLRFWQNNPPGVAWEK